MADTTTLEGSGQAARGASRSFPLLDRQAESFEQAVRSAIADVQKAGCRVAWVKIELDDLAMWAPTADVTAAKK